MRALSNDERKAYVDEMSAKRSAVQKQIEELSEKHDAFVREEMKRQSLDDSQGFDNAMRRAIMEQAGKRGIRFKETGKTGSADGKEESPAKGEAGLLTDEGC